MILLVAKPIVKSTSDKFQSIDAMRASMDGVIDKIEMVKSIVLVK